MTPLIPFVNAPEVSLGFVFRIPGISRLFDPAQPPSIKPFGVLVGVAGALGFILAARHAKARGLDQKKILDFTMWIAIGGFVGGHVFDALLYHPADVVKNPRYLFAIADGLSSYGGFLGAALAALLWKVVHKDALMPYVEAVASIFPLVWVLGRAGCAVVHDHPGRLSDAWLAVRFPTVDGGFVGRFDLGLCEMVLTIPLAIAFAILWHRQLQRPLGFYVGVMCVAYAPVRFFLDFLRIDDADYSATDPRYAGLTPAQWACFALLAVGLYFLRLASRAPPSIIALGEIR